MGGEPRDPVSWLATSRRRFLTIGAAAIAAGALKGMPALADVGSRRPAEPGRRLDYPFGLGVASGDPLPDSVVLWTRLAPHPYEPFGGMDDRVVPVQWELAEDDRFRRIVAQGTEVAVPDLAYSVHVDVRGLRAWREYFYRFRVGPHVSPVGRTKTAPAAGADLRSMTLALASCQAWWDGYYTVYTDMAARQPDVVFHAGDYVYEIGIAPDGGSRQTPVPSLFSPETVSLDEYRDRYALYKADPDLQAAHHAAPWIVTMDDHEVENNWAGAISEGNEPVDRFLIRRANAFRAWYEHMPVRTSQLPVGPDLQLYRSFTYGSLVDINVLDTRQYRDDQAAGDGADPPNPGSMDPARTITGAAQEQWLLDRLATSSARWDVLAHQTAIARLDHTVGDAVTVPMDTWDGYEGSRNRILGGAYERGVRNLVSIAGDLHRTVASDLKLDFSDPASPVVATEIVGTSISSGRDGEDLDAIGAIFNAENEHIKFGNFQRGYVHCTITPERWDAEFRVADYVTRPGSPISTRTRLVIEDGRPGIQQG
jgi:phosphodiesterase/alkaline phosphatase D-like protein